MALIEHGFSGFHVPVACRWFDIEHIESSEIQSDDPNPDPRTFEALELLITKTHAAGGVVHLWAWGDNQRKQTPAKWGINGKADKRLQRYIAARLGPLPGWTMGYGFDLWEWVEGEQLAEWRWHMHAHFGWPHMLGARASKNKLDQLTEVLDYSSYEQHRPDYAMYVKTIERRLDKPSFSEDRFRIRKSRYPEKDYDLERTRRGLSQSAMAGGVANIWGYLLVDRAQHPDAGPAFPYPDPHAIRTSAEFFRKRFLIEFVRDNTLTDGVCLRTPGNTHFLFYREDADSLRLDLTKMKAEQRAVAVDARKPYEEIELGRLAAKQHDWKAPYRSDWAIAVGEFPGRRGKLSFRHHYIDRDLPGDSYGQTSLVDIDRDGDLDFITGGRDVHRSVFWFEFRKPDEWVRHILGTQHPSDVGGTAIDVDRDGWIDHVAGGVWYRNTGKPSTEPFERIVFDEKLSAVHDLVAADLDRDGRLDVVTMSDKNNLRWYRIPADPREPWLRHDIGAGVHAGVAVGDIDGDGDPDVARSNIWFENADGMATKWADHRIPFGNPAQPYPLATRCRIIDLDRDGDADLVMTENEIRAGRIAWLENVDGKGRRWTTHDLQHGDAAARGAYHSLAVEDFDNDGDWDIFSVEMEAIPGDRQPRWFIWENLDGRGAKFVERVIFDGNLGGHEAVAADVDADGDLDICSKLWRPRGDNANRGRNHADFLENHLINRSVAGR